MLLDIDHHLGIPIYRQVIDQVRHQILSGLLVEEEKLSSVRDLASSLKVNPMTVSKAYSYLEMEGLVERRRGIGLFVAKVKKGQLDKIKTKLFDNAINKSAVTAIQLGVSEEDAIEFFRKHYREYKTKNRRIK